MNDAVGLTVGKSLFLMGVSILILAVFLTLYMIATSGKAKEKIQKRMQEKY